MAVVVDVVVAGEGELAAVAQGQREEDLGGCSAPDLEMDENRGKGEFMGIL